MRFQNAQALSVSVGNTYSEYQHMHTFLDNFHQGGKYYAQIASHQAELRREGRFTDHKYLYISSLQTGYLNLDSSSGCGRNSDRANTVKKSAPFVKLLINLQKMFQKDHKGKGKSLCSW